MDPGQTPQNLQLIIMAVLPLGMFTFIRCFDITQSLQDWILQWRYPIPEFPRLLSIYFHHPFRRLSSPSCQFRYQLPEDVHDLRR